MLTEEQKAELKSILDAAVVERVDEEMKKIPERKFTPAKGIVPADGEPTGDKSGEKFKTFGEFLRATKLATNPNGRQFDPRLKALSEGVDSAGGFLVPEEFRANLLARNLEAAVIRPYATTIPMTRDTVNIPKIVDTSHASTLFGGVVAYWTEEAGTKTTSDPAFGQVKLIAKKLTGYTYASDELLDDSAIALEALLTRLFGDALRWYEDVAFLRGNGVGQPLGIFSSGAFINPTRATASQVALADLANIMARMYPDSLYGPNTIWILSPAVLAQLIQLVTTVITWMPASGGASARVPAAIMGMPFRITEKVPTLGTTGDIGLYDLSYYLIGDRKDLRIDSSMHVRFTTDETAWRFVERVEGQPWVDSAFTPYNSGATLSPFVGLSSATA